MEKQNAICKKFRKLEQCFNVIPSHSNFVRRKVQQIIEYVIYSKIPMKLLHLISDKKIQAGSKQFVFVLSFFIQLGFLFLFYNKTMFSTND